MSPDADVRKTAAESIFKSGDPEQIELLDAAIAAEQDPAIARLMAEARAAAVLKSDLPDAEKLAAIQVLTARGGNDALSILTAVGASSEGEVQAAALGGVSIIQGELAIWDIGQNVWYGISLGSVLLLAAIGLAITFGVMGVINMAHGEMVMLGAYTTFVVQEVIRLRAPWLFDWSLAIAIPLSFLVAGLVGIAIERGVIRFLYGRALETLLATWGISLILQQSVRTIFGPTNKQVGNPTFMSGSFDIGNLSITWNRLWIVVFAIAVFAALMMVLKRTPFGLQMRAVTQNRPMASAMGIRTPWIDALTFGLGSGIAGMAGVALSQIDNVSPNLGQSYIIDSFMVVVFGGVGNLWGTLVGAFTLGIANKFLEPYAGAVLGKIAILVIIILFIQKRPRGLFALKGRAVEA
jgi:urea transport system permease protein